MNKDYYAEVGNYYDRDVELGFVNRANTNGSLNRIRNAFRSFLQRIEFSSAIELGCGPGFDVEWFGRTYPTKTITAIDVSAEMCACASERCASLDNVVVKQGSEHDLMTLVDDKVDLVFVFFGALNTTENLDKAAQRIYDRLEPGGYALLTFVNKLYLRELIVNLLKLRIKTAFARLRPVWGGYSVNRHLPSKCYTPRDIRASFSNFEEVAHRGFSILYPAWYNDFKIAQKPANADRLWRIDQKLNSTPLWQYGEYTLFLFRKPIA